MSTVFERANGAHDFLNRHLDVNGDGSGAHEGNVNGSVTPVLFRIDPPATGAHVLHRLHVVIEGTGSFRTNTYGPLAELANGVQVGYFSASTGDVLDDLTSTHPITSNFGWTLHAFPTEVYTWGGGASHLVAAWDFVEDGLALLVDSRYPDRSFGVKVRDDLSSLIAHEFIAYGYSTR